MSNLEHLIENTLVAMEDDKLCPKDIRERIKNDINILNTSLSVDDVWEICQYVYYTWDRSLLDTINKLEQEKLKFKEEREEQHNEIEES